MDSSLALLLPILQIVSDTYQRVARNELSSGFSIPLINSATPSLIFA
jgi:hypothetical protein